ncbi:hypothetical protein CONPUDRAFT_71584 [Coniophora puteana RWD-64-598 SS2]|uniref:Uncharacterized protein n=1 Tax=Coniophora puteana (strain RWD-64-598) TaxID=741705 RepID=A0A5M3MW08_CONPW|nr:uncharacterized protein CONPUDRAFT_71584 [Coniophora puteana RWD-64-598 SS2]EIW82914.1 hypothetical protein CONPUDRAFT_71584 [Coniophora puteana RWD-64-598 SS2]
MSATTGTSELKTIRKKRAAASDGTAAPTPAPEGDHRKRRRNRTTQSCLNCHTSKRMVGSALGTPKPLLTFFVASSVTGNGPVAAAPNLDLNDLQDESSRLRKRVAELEGVIREVSQLKNKPHPRWVQSGITPSEGLEKWHARAQSRSASSDGDDNAKNSAAPSPRLANACTADIIAEASSSLRASPPNSFLAPSSFTSPSPDAALPNLPPCSPYYGMSSSPQSTPSPAMLTPNDEYSRSQAMIAGSEPQLDLASIFMSYPGLMGCEDTLSHTDRSFGGECLVEPMEDSSLSSKHLTTRFHDGHCGCLGESQSYNAILELSLRLRKAAYIMNRSTNHRLGSGCILNQRIAELDALASTTLGNINSPPNEFQAVHTRSRAATLPSSAAHSTGHVAPTVSPNSLQGFRSWELMQSSIPDSNTCDDSFMSWEPSRRG